MEKSAIPPEIPASGKGSTPVLEAAASAPQPEAPPPIPGTWRAGTLVYTAGGLVVLFSLLLLGDFAWAMRERSVGPMAQWYLSKIGVSNFHFALLVSSFPALLGMLLGPIISVKSDRHRGKWGRRIPFLLVTTPLAAFGMIGLGVTPLVAKWVHGHFPDQSEMAVSVACFAVFWTAFEIAAIASQAVFGGLVNDVVPTELLGRFYGLFRMVSLVDGIIFNYWIMGKVPDHFVIILTLIGSFYGICFLVVCLLIKEGEYPPLPPADPRKPNPLAGFFLEAGKYFRECFKNPYYVAVFIMLMAAGLTFSPVNIYCIPFAKSLGVDMEHYGKAVALTYAISLVLAFPLGWITDIVHPIRTAMGALVGYLVVSIWGAVYATTPQTFLVAWVLHGVLSGTYFTCAASLGQRLFPRSKYAQFASASGIVGALATVFLAPGIGFAIDSSGVDRGMAAWIPGIGLVLEPLGKNFRLTFWLGAIFAAIALVTAWFVYVRFKILGGPKAYVAPE